MTYEIGDTVKIVVAKADIDQGQIDFVMAEGRRNVQKTSKPVSKRGPAQDNSRGVRKSRVSQPRRPR